MTVHKYNNELLEKIPSDNIFDEKYNKDKEKEVDLFSSNQQENKND